MGYEDQLQHQDLHAQLAISTEEALQGTVRTLNLADQQLTIPIPPGVYPGQSIRIIGHGIPGQAGTARGDLVLTLVVVPKSQIPPSLTKFPSQMPASFLPPGVAPIQQPPHSQIHALKGQPGHYQVSEYTEYHTPSPPQTYQPLVYNYRPNSYISSHKRHSNIFLFFCLFITCVVMAISLSVYYTEMYLPAQRSIQATATAVAYTTAQTQLHATSLAQAQATLTAHAQATATTVSVHQNQYARVLDKAPTWYDPLHMPGSSRWDVGQGCGFSQGAYVVTETNKGFFLYCTARNTLFSNFAYQVQMTILKGSFGGITFRENKNRASFYLFLVGKDGSYSLYFYPDNAGKDSKLLLMGTSSHIRTGTNHINTLTVLAHASTIDLYVNGYYLTSTNNKAQSAGQIGVVADDVNTVTQVRYTQAQVWKL